MPDQWSVDEWARGCMDGKPLIPSPITGKILLEHRPRTGRISMCRDCARAYAAQEYAVHKARADLYYEDSMVMMNQRDEAYAKLDALQRQEEDRQ